MGEVVAALDVLRPLRSLIRERAWGTNLCELPFRRGRAIARNSASVIFRASCHFLAERKTCLKL